MIKYLGLLGGGMIAVATGLLAKAHYGLSWEVVVISLMMVIGVNLIVMLYSS